MTDLTKPVESLPQGDDVRTWLESQMTGERSMLLAFADDGVIWGRLMDRKLITGPDQPKLRGKTLQQAFVFGPKDEICLFRSELGDWQARQVTDAGDVILESQILWGNESHGDPQDGFVEVSEFRKGIPNQFLPVDRALGDDECVRLEVHHLVEYDEKTGEARIALSRLAGLSIAQRDVEVAK